MSSGIFGRLADEVHLEARWKYQKEAKGTLWVADTGNDRISAWTWPLNTTTYGYDQAGDLTSIARPKAGENTAISQTLAYDATGLLTAKTIGGTTRHLAWDQSTNLPLLLNDGENSYIYGPGGIPVEQINGKEEPTYLHHDQLGSTRLLTGSGGATTATQSFAPYGTLEAKTGTATTPFGFAGQYTDSEPELQYLRARFYDPGTGQFLSRDPWGMITRQLYDYAANNPINLIDLTGQDAIAINGTADTTCGLTWEVPGVDVVSCGTAGLIGLGTLADSLFGNEASVKEAEEGLLRAQAEHEEDEEDCRNWRQDKKVTERELEEAGLDAHKLKRGEKFTDIYKDREGPSMKSRREAEAPEIPLGLISRTSSLKDKNGI
ncbi:MAG: RHS repeat-associated core domain-containing protein [Solirubrobacterales bacterium]